MSSIESLFSEEDESKSAEEPAKCSDKSSIKNVTYTGSPLEEVRNEDKLFEEESKETVELKTCKIREVENEEPLHDFQ